MSIDRKRWGCLGTGEDVDLFILERGGIRASLSSYGAALVSLSLPATGGLRDDLVLGWESLAGYDANHPFFGVTVGRYANRIGAARFTLDGREYLLEPNDGPNMLHGGRHGFDKRVWAATGYEEGGNPRVRFELLSPDGDGGFPGRLEVVADVGLRTEGTLSIRYEARSDAPTPVSLTNHAYWNLRGEGSGDVLDHELSLAASSYLPVTEALLPRGGPEPVDGGPFDFRRPRPIGEGISAAGGYDHCFVIDRDGPGLVEFARVREPRTGRLMRVATSLPGVQLYSGNFLAGESGKRGSRYHRHGGFCLETQMFPDSPNRPGYPSCILRPGSRWEHETSFSFEY